MQVVRWLPRMPSRGLGASSGVGVMGAKRPDERSVVEGGSWLSYAAIHPYVGKTASGMWLVARREAAVAGTHAPAIVF